MTKKSIVVLIILVALVIGLSASRSNSEVINSREVKIGVLAPLTGQISVLGERMRNGMELAVEDLLAAGTVDSLEIIYEDACFPKESVNAAKKLIEADKVKIIGGSFCLLGIDAVVPLSESAEVVLFNTAANPDSVLNRDFVFSTNVAIRDDARKLAEYAYNELGARKAAMIHFDSSFGENYKRYFAQYFAELGGELVYSVGKTLDATEFRTEVAQVKAADPDVFLAIHFGASLGNILKEAYQLGLDVPTLGHYEAEDPTVLNFAGAAAEGFTISSSQPDVRTKTVTRFERNYQDRYGEMPDVLASNSYDSIMLQVMAYVECDGDTSCIATVLENTKDYQGVSGSITIDATDHSTKKETIFKVVQDGQFVPVN